MYYLPDNLPRPGDMVVTSGVGSTDEEDSVIRIIFPKGIPIGTVRESTRSMDANKQYIVVEPKVDFQHIEYVIVLRYKPDATAIEKPEDTSDVRNATPAPSIAPAPTPAPAVIQTPQPENNGLEYQAPEGSQEETTTPAPAAPPTPSPAPAFSLDQLTVDEIKSVENLEHMDFTTSVTYDKTERKTIAQNYGNIGGVGIDSTLYVDKSNVDLYLPILNGYYNLNNSEKQSEYEASAKFAKIFDPILTKFVDLLTKEDIMKGKRTYITTADGQIKTTVYTVTMNENQLKQLMEEFIQLIEKEDIDFGQILDIDMGDIDVPKEMSKWIDSFTLTSFSSTAYVDFDGRLVKQELTAELAFREDGSSKGPDKLKVSEMITFSGLGEKQDMEFPEITQDMYLEKSEENSYFPHGKLVLMP
jgi:hypothetical protein